MTFLPIVGRELREGARRSGTYWLRVRVAAQALVVGVVAYFIALSDPSIKLGTPLFWGLSGVSMLFCLLAGRRSTADCISQEKREGTLGLLFLTDLKGYDVVLGKVVGTSISGFFSLMAIFPVLAIPLLTGGMTNGELWRMALVLANTFFVSVAIGIFASAVSREYRMAMAVNFCLLLLLLAVPAGCGIGLDAAGSRWFSPRWYYSCPIFSFVCCADEMYGVKWAAGFWWSVADQCGLGLILVLLACFIVPRNWGDRPAPTATHKWRWRDLGRLIIYGSLDKRAAFRKRALEVNPFYWLAGRARLKPAHVWLFLAAAALWFFYGWYKERGYWIDLGTFISTGVIINSALKLWITVEAGHRFGEDRRSGAFELLLPTPLTVRDYLHGQMLALRRQFLKPLLVVTALELTLVAALHRSFDFDRIAKVPTGELTMIVITLLAGVGMLWADVITLAWVSMAAAFTCKSQTKATSFTVARILILPWVGFLSISFAIGACGALGLTRWYPGERFGLGLWFVLGIAADLLFGLFSWRQLTKNFRQLAAQSVGPERPLALWRVLLRMAVKAMAFPMRPFPPCARIPVAACLALGIALAVTYFAVRPERVPPPVLVSMTQSNAPLKIFPMNEGAMFVLPDGSLWRWGKTGWPKFARAAMPEQIGTGRDWVKVVNAGPLCLGLRTNGTIWEWGHGIDMSEHPHPDAQEYDWVDLAITRDYAVGVRRDGTLWKWNAKSMARLDSGSNWIAVCCVDSSTIALRADGTLWVGGRIGYSKGAGWTNSTVAFPALLCAASNWIALDARGLARNRAGELWDASRAMPDAKAGVAAVCSLVSSNWAADRIQFLGHNNMRIKVCADGTLWADSPGSNDLSQISARTDWTAVWFQWPGTGYGLTADGTVWTWGYDLGKDPDAFAARVKVLRDRMAQGPSANGDGFGYPYSAQPRPLFKLTENRRN